MTGAERIAAERQRQVEQECWSPEHDAEHLAGELALAAGCYALGHGECHDPEEPPHPWPWDASWWKPGDGSTEGRIRELEKAGALIAAEIDRLLREVAGA